MNNKPGVLVRVALVFARRGYNIESLVVSPTARGDFSRMTITCRGDPETLEQIIKQLTKLIDVVHAIDHTGDEAVRDRDRAGEARSRSSTSAPRSCRSPSTTAPRSSTTAPSR